MSTKAPDAALQPGLPPISPSRDDSEPPNGGYGWVVCISMTLINGFTWGIIASYGVYLSYYISHNTFEGTTDLDFTFIGGANFATAMLISPFVNVLIRRYGTNLTMYLGCFLFAGGFIAASFAREFWQLALSQGVLVGLGVGTVWLPASPILATWFTTKRSFAQGCASSGSGLVGLVFSLATTPMIENISLAWSLRIIGIVSFVVLLIASVLMKDRHSTIRPKIQPLDASLLSRYQIWMVIGYTFFSIMGYIILLYSLGAFALSIGLTQRQGGIVVALLNAGSAVVRVQFGILSDRYGRITMVLLITASNVIFAFAWWIPLSSFAPLAVFAFIIGGTSGVYWAAIAPLCAEVVDDLKDLPSTLSLMWLTVSMPALFSEAIALEIRRPSTKRAYLYPQIFTGLTFLIASLFLLELRRVKLGLTTKERHR